MASKTSAPEYQGPLRDLPVDASYEDVLARAERAVTTARLEYAHARLAQAEACRRLGRLAEAEQAWRDSYRTARTAGSASAMAWAMWNAGTLDRQRGRYALARRWLERAVQLAEGAGDTQASGYARAGIAETGRIQGDHLGVLELHRELLAEARERGEARHIVWALEGLAQIHRHTGDRDQALEMFTEAAQVAEAAGDRRGHAWAQRGRADLLSLRGETEQALRLLSDGESACQAMSLLIALAYNHKMRGNVLLRANRAPEAAELYRRAQDEFAELDEPRGHALASLGLIKSQAHNCCSTEQTERELQALRERVADSGLSALIAVIDSARERYGTCATSDQPTG